MPTTVKRVQKLKAMRRAQQEKLREKQRREEEEEEREAEEQEKQQRKGYKSKVKELGEDSRKKDEKVPKDSKDGEVLKGWPGTGSRQEERTPDLMEGHKERTPDLMEDMMDMSEPKTVQVAKSSGNADLLSLDNETPAVPTDFSKPIERTELPAQLSFDTRFCAKQPLPAAVAAGIVQPRGNAQVVQQLTTDEGDGLLSLDMGAAMSLPNAPSNTPGGLPANLMQGPQATIPAQTWPDSLADMLDVTAAPAPAPHKAASSFEALDPLGFT